LVFSCPIITKWFKFYRMRITHRPYICTVPAIANTVITSSCRQILSFIFFLLLFVVIIIFILFIIILDEFSLRTAKQSGGQDRAGAVNPPVIQVRCWGYLPYRLFSATHFGWLWGLPSFTVVLQFAFTRSNLEPHHGRAL
jgi:hypothetical protein